MRNKDTWPWAWAIVRTSGITEGIAIRPGPSIATEDLHLIGPYWTKADAETDARKMHGVVVRILLPVSDAEETRLKALLGPPFEP